MEHYVNSIEDHLIDGLKFKLEPGASHVQSRRNVSWFPSGSAIYSPTSGTRLIRININSTGEWLDPCSVRFSFRLNNTDTELGHKLRTMGDPLAFFNRFLILVGSGVCEEIVDYSRTHNLFQTLTSANSRVNDDIEGFGHRWTDQGFDGQYSTDGIHPGQSKRVNFKLFTRNILTI